MVEEEIREEKRGSKNKKKYTTYILASPSTGTVRTVQKVLLQTETSLGSEFVGSEFRARTAEHAIAIVTGIRIVALCITAHDGLALLVA